MITSTERFLFGLAGTVAALYAPLMTLIQSALLVQAKGQNEAVARLGELGFSAFGGVAAYMVFQNGPLLLLFGVVGMALLMRGTAPENRFELFIHSIGVPGTISAVVAGLGISV